MADKWNAMAEKPRPFLLTAKMVSGNIVGGAGGFGFGKWRKLKDVTTGWWGEDAAVKLNPSSGGGAGGGAGDSPASPTNLRRQASSGLEKEPSMHSGQWMVMGSDGKAAVQDRPPK